MDDQPRPDRDLTDVGRAEAIARAILEAAHTGLPGDGIVAVLPVEHLYRIRTQSEVVPDGC